MLCVCHTTPTQKLFCGPPQRVDCLAPKWETALSVFPKNTATRYRIGSFATFRLLARRFYQLSHAAATNRYCLPKTISISSATNVFHNIFMFQMLKNKRFVS